MPYNKSIKAVARAQTQLEQLYRSRKTIDWATKNPSRLAYQLREAIYAAQFHNKYRHFSELKYIYEFQQLNGSVRAHYMGLDVPESLIQEIETPVDNAGTDVGAPEMPPTQLDSVSSLREIIGAMVSLGDVSHEVFFPDAVLQDDDLRRLYDWSTETGWSLISHEGAGVTLTRRTVSKELLYDPSDD